jgi:nucleotide-binding universal stress UspA family protein
MKITIVGAGNMGRGIGTRAIAGGHEVEVLDRDPAEARALADQLGGSTNVLDREAAEAIAPGLEEHGEPAVNVLVSASESADLLVVGSRGLHGLKALGSVSERVAHQARSSVLVVRPGRT